MKICNLKYKSAKMDEDKSSPSVDCFKICAVTFKSLTPREKDLSVFF